MPKFKRFESQIVSIEKEPRVYDLVAVEDDAPETLLSKLKKLVANMEIDYQKSFGERRIGGKKEKREWLEDIAPK